MGRRIPLPAVPEAGEIAFPGEQQVLCDLGEIGVVGGGRLEEPLLDTFQPIPDSGNIDKALEVFHYCRWYYGETGQETDARSESCAVIELGMTGLGVARV
jgi:hypothetical protein